MTEPLEYVRNPTRARLDEQQAIIAEIVRAYWYARLIARRIYRQFSETTG